MSMATLQMMMIICIIEYRHCEFRYLGDYFIIEKEKLRH